MAFQRGTFCGSTVRSYTSQIGWSVGQPSQIAVSLVDDIPNGDRFSPPLPGSPAYFSYGNSDFFGLFQKYEVKNAVDGRPVYEVILTDPRELLDGAQVIIGSYRGPTGGIPNLINAFGYWENLDFGASGSNEAGMPWYKILQALETICNSGAGGTFGGPLVLNGVSYGLDLSQLPFPSNSYRLGGTSISLMDAIAQICEDGGCDFFVRLRGFTIQIVTVSRVAQPQLGTIQRVVNEGLATGTVTRASVGLEFRNEVTSSFVIGGPVTTLFQTDQSAIRSFWGYDPDGFAIWSSNYNLELKDNNGNVIVAFPTEAMLLNAGPVADIVGSDRYFCTTFEMQLAKSNYDTWAMYMVGNRADQARAWKILSTFTGVDPSKVLNPLMSDLVDIDATTAALVTDDTANDAMRLYEFVKGYADEYYGRKYAVALPFVMQYREEETLRVVSSYNIADSGYLEEGSTPLGMSEANEDQFRNPDGRFRCFVKFADVRDVDLSNIPPQSSVVDIDGSLFVEANADSQILFEDTPYALVTLPGVLSELPIECPGDPAILGALMNVDGDKFMESSKHEFMPFSVSPEVIAPFSVAVPLQSNLYTYGPWYAAGPAGKVLCEQDTGLTPWDYGDYVTMQNAGASKVNNAITNMQFSESGVLEVAGAPTISLGDVLRSGGPNVTNIDVNISTQGVTTTYRFQTYTPRYGVFNKGTGERLKRLGLSGQSLRRSMRVAERNFQAKVATKSVAAAKAATWRDNLPAYKKKKTPHGLIVAHCFNDEDGNGNPITRGTMQSATHADAITLSSPSNPDEFQNTAIMSFNGLFRPFSTDASISRASGDVNTLSGFETLQNIGDSPLNAVDLNPFQAGHDIETFTYGNSFESLNGFRNQADPDKSRLFALRGPVVVSGWGYGWDGSKFPSDDNGETFIDSHMRRQDRWKTGPVDMLWDDNRKVWTSHDIIPGSMTETLPQGGSGLFRAVTGWEFYIHNHFSQPVSGDVNVIAGYSALDNKWYAMAADCVS